MGGDLPIDEFPGDSAGLWIVAPTMRDAPGPAQRFRDLSQETCDGGLVLELNQ